MVKDIWPCRSSTRSTRLCYHIFRHKVAYVNGCEKSRLPKLSSFTLFLLRRTNDQNHISTNWEIGSLNVFICLFVFFLFYIFIQWVLIFDWLFSFQFDLVCEDKKLPKYAQSIFFVGTLAGSIVMGILSDRYGHYYRRELYISQSVFFYINQHTIQIPAGINIPPDIHGNILSVVLYTISQTYVFGIMYW